MQQELFQLCEAAGINPGLELSELFGEVHENHRIWQRRTNAPDLLRRQEAERRMLALDALEAFLKRCPQAAATDLSSRRVLSPEVAAIRTEAWRLLDQGNYQKALYLAQQWTDLSKRDSGPWVLRAQIFERQGKFIEAAQEMEMAVSLSPQNAAYRHQWALLLARFGDYRAAKAQAAMACQLKPDRINHRQLLERIENRLEGRG